MSGAAAPTPRAGTCADPLYTSRLRAALRLAESAHRDQRRKGSADVPYIVHPVAVAAALAGAGACEDLVCAGYLHDVVEDSPHGIGEIAERFGARVAELVLAVTEEKRDRAGADIPWEIRKDRQLAHLGSMDDPDVFALKAADLLVNLTDIVLDYEEIGDAIWMRFRRGRSHQLAYYRAAAQLVLPRVRGHLPRLAASLEGAVERLDAVESAAP